MLSGPGQPYDDTTMDEGMLPRRPPRRRDEEGEQRGPLPRDLRRLTVEQRFRLFGTLRWAKVVAADKARGKEAKP